MESIWVTMFKAQAEVERAYAVATKPFSLSPLQAHVLLALFEKDGQSASQLAQAVGRMATSFTPVIDGLVAQGLVYREDNPTDRRGIHVRLTDTGKRLRPELIDRVRQVDADVRRVLGKLLAEPAKIRIAS